MKEKIKAYILGLLEASHTNSLYRRDLIEIIQNQFRGTRPRVVSLCISELIGEYKIASVDTKLRLTEIYKHTVQQECLLAAYQN